MLGTLSTDPIKTGIVIDTASDCKAINILVRLVCISFGTGQGFSVHNWYGVN